MMGIDGTSMPVGAALGQISVPMAALAASAAFCEGYPILMTHGMPRLARVVVSPFHHSISVSDIRLPEFP